MNGTHRIRYVNSPTSNLVVPLPCERWAYFMIMGNLELIKLEERDGKQVVSARELYVALGYDVSNYAKWAKSNIVDNPYAIENEDWVLLVLNDECSRRGQRAQDYALSIIFAKKLAMVSKTEVGNKIRDYFIECEEMAKKSVIAIPNFTDPAEAAEAWAREFRAKEAALLEAKSAQENVKRLVHDRKTYTTSEIAKELGLKSANQLNKFLEDAGIQYKLNGTWLLYSNYSDLDYTSTKQIVLDNGHVAYDRRWTGLGRDFILTILEPTY